MAQVAPEPMTMDREALVKRFGDLEDKEGSVEFVTMRDGWKLKRESWTPAGTEVKGVMLFFHGTGESTRTVGMRRLAFACLKRGIVLETYDRHGHGDSLHKNGKPFMPPAFAGSMIDTKGTNTEHAVEIAELVMKKHGKPLMIMGHSGGGETACMATDRIIAACEQNNVRFATAIYLAPGVHVLNTMAPCGLTCCHYGCAIPCWFCCCCNCCGRPCLKTGAHKYNPGGVLGPVNTGDGYVNCDQLWIESSPYPKGSASLTDAVQSMTKLASGLLFNGSKDEMIPPKIQDKLAKEVPALTHKISDGRPHDVLNMNMTYGDTTSVEIIEEVMTWAEEQLNAK